MPNITSSPEQKMNSEESGVHLKVEGTAFSPEEQAFFDKANDNKSAKTPSVDNKKLFETGEFSKVEKNWLGGKKE